nr:MULTISPECIES: hypothetical protein [unclassified Pseudomonas]
MLPTDASAAFNAGQIDAWATFDPYLGIAEQHGARLLRDGQGLTTALGFLTATPASLEDPAKRAAIADFAGRLAQARAWAVAHPQDYARVYAELTRLPEGVAVAISTRTSRGLRPVQPADVAAVQQVADLFSELQVLPKPVDVAALADASVFTQEAKP